MSAGGKTTSSTTLATTDFSIHNLPYGIFSRRSGPKKNVRSVGVALGNKIIDCHALAQHGIIPNPGNSFYVPGSDSQTTSAVPTLNKFMSQSKSSWDEVREVLKGLVQDSSDSSNGSNSTSNSKRSLADIASTKKLSLSSGHGLIEDQDDCIMHLPATIGDYTDFYASREHATNVGCMFRDPENALLPNWLHIPVGYHGRASSVVVSGTPIYRPNGQTVSKDMPNGPPSFGPSKLVDFELEVGAFIGGNDSESQLGPHNVLSQQECEDRIFGLVLLNDWSARDLQKWEYVPLGPFLAKNFGTTISPWVVPLAALKEFRHETPQQIDPLPLPYLRQKQGEKQGFDINLEVELEVPGISDSTGPSNTASKVICNSNLKYMYWSLTQQLTHHCSNGCNMRSGDLIGTGTISGPTPNSYGSLLELTWAGKNEVKVSEEVTRKFLQDGDSIIMRGYAENKEKGYRVGFGECRGQLLGAKQMEFGE